MAFLANIKGWAIAVLGAIVAIFLAYFRGKSSGKAEAQVDNTAAIAKQDAEARKEVQNVANEVDSKNDAAVTDELIRDWVRKPPTGKDGG